jgi:AAHS family 4-hydroxybenzoate transporter-like MFS transporter
VTASRAITAQDVIDSAPLSRTQFRALALLMALAVVDGFNSLVIGFVIPAISRDWGVTPASLTGVTLAGLVGVIAGTMLLSPLLTASVAVR